MGGNKNLGVKLTNCRVMGSVCEPHHYSSAESSLSFFLARTKPTLQVMISLSQEKYELFLCPKIFVSTFPPWTLELKRINVSERARRIPELISNDWWGGWSCLFKSLHSLPVNKTYKWFVKCTLGVFRYFMGLRLVWNSVLITKYKNASWGAGREGQAGAIYAGLVPKCN